MTPFEIVYGRPPPSLPSYVRGETHVEVVDHELLDPDEILRQLKYRLYRAQNKMSKSANTH